MKIKVVINSPFEEVNNGWVYRYVNLLKGLMQYFSLFIFIPGSSDRLKEQLPDANIFGYDKNEPLSHRFNKIRLVNSYIRPQKEQIYLPGFKCYPGFETFISQNDVAADAAIYFGLDSLIFYGQNDKTPIIFCDFCDSTARSLANQMKAKRRNPLLIFIDLAYLKRIKRRFISSNIKVIGITDTDCAYIKKTLPHNEVITVPNGIMNPSGTVDLKSKYESDTIIFIGSLNYLPNEDSICFIVKEIWPEISVRFRSLKLLIVGRNPGKVVTDLCANDPRILLRANVENVYSFLEKSKLFLCPMFLGGGMKNKIMEALISYTPVITNKEGAIGIPMVNREHGYIAESKEGFLNGITEMLSISFDRYKQIAQNCFKLASKYSWAQISIKLKEMIINESNC
jgi:glycosyltransferase involved in cell wall biosynthesis